LTSTSVSFGDRPRRRADSVRLAASPPNAWAVKDAGAFERTRIEHLDRRGAVDGFQAAAARAGHDDGCRFPIRGGDRVDGRGFHRGGGGQGHARLQQQQDGCRSAQDVFAAEPALGGKQAGDMPRQRRRDRGGT
jgi:hypothetical protein